MRSKCVSTFLKIRILSLQSFRFSVQNHELYMDLVFKNRNSRHICFKVNLFFFNNTYITFLLLLKQMIMNLVVQKNTNSVSYTFGGQQSELSLVG